MGIGTSRHEDEQLPCRRSRMRSADDRARFAGMGDKLGVRFGKTAEAKVQPTSGRSVCS